MSSNEIMTDIPWRVASLILVFVPAAFFHIISDFMHLVVEGRSHRFADFWMTQVLLGVGSWVYLVPLFSASLLALRTIPGKGLSATPLVLFVFLVLSSMLWAFATLGMLEPFSNPEALIG